MTNNIKPTLVLLPGFDGTGRLFSPLFKQLPSCLETVVLSYPNDKPMTYQELCHLLKDELPDTSYVLLGESFGGPLAMLLSKRASSNLKGIILCASFVKNPHPLLANILRPILSPSYHRKEIPTWIIKRYLLGGLSDEKLIKNIKAVNRELTPEVFYCRLKEIADVDVTNILEKCELPILYLRASRDRLVSKNSMRLIEMFGGKAKIQVFDAPHMLLQTQPKQAAESIRNFVSGVV